LQTAQAARRSDPLLIADVRRLDGTTMLVKPRRWLAYTVEVNDLLPVPDGPGDRTVAALEICELIRGPRMSEEAPDNNAVTPAHSDLALGCK